MKRYPLTILVAMALLPSSCVHRNFEYDDGRLGYVEVVFDWMHDPSADPKSMMLLMYPREGGDALRFDFAGREGGIIRIAPGVYDGICMNSDKRGVLYENEDSFAAFTVTTEELENIPLGSNTYARADVLPKAPGTEDQPIYDNPPMMWSSSETGFDVTVNSGIRTNMQVDHQILTLYPKPIVDTYMVTVKNIKNVENIRTLSGTLSDMSSGYLAGEQADTDNAAILPFELTAYQENKRAEGTFLTFGHCPGERRSHKLMLYAILTDATKYYWEFDVSDQAHNPPDEHGIHHIIVEFLDIPELGGESNMGANVGDWSSNDIYVVL